MASWRHRLSIVNLRWLQPSRSASSAASRPILLRNLKQSTTVEAGLKTGTLRPSLFSRVMPLASCGVTVKANVYSTNASSILTDELGSLCALDDICSATRLQSKAPAVLAREWKVASPHLPSDLCRDLCRGLAAQVARYTVCHFAYSANIWLTASWSALSSAMASFGSGLALSETAVLLRKQP